MLTREQILKASATKVLKVATPEWGGSGQVYVRMLPGYEVASAAEILDTGSDKSADSDKSEMIARLCVLFIGDEYGKRILKPGDTKRLLNGPIAPLMRCMNAALDLNGLSDASQENILKNSQRVRSNGRGTSGRGSGVVRSRKRKPIRARAS